MLSGLGHIIAGLSIKAKPRQRLELSDEAPLRIESDSPPPGRYDPAPTVATVPEPPVSVTDRTTNILDRDRHWQSR
jgi:hypothetical protein